MLAHLVQCQPDCSRIFNKVNQSQCEEPRPFPFLHHLALKSATHVPTHTLIKFLSLRSLQDENVSTTICDNNLMQQSYWGGGSRLSVLEICKSKKGGFKQTSRMRISAFDAAKAAAAAKDQQQQQGTSSSANRYAAGAGGRRQLARQLYWERQVYAWREHMHERLRGHHRWLILGSAAGAVALMLATAEIVSLHMRVSKLERQLDFVHNDIGDSYDYT